MQYDQQKHVDMLRQMQYNQQKETELLRKLFVLTAKRSMRPAMSDNMAMRLIFEELLLLTDKDEYRL